jgi:hypothetical protein
MFSASPVLGAPNHCWKSSGQALFYICLEQSAAAYESSPLLVYWNETLANPHIRGADFSLRLHHIPAPRRLKSALLLFLSLPAVSVLAALPAPHTATGAEMWGWAW